MGYVFSDDCHHEFTKSGWCVWCGEKATGSDKRPRPKPKPKKKHVRYRQRRDRRN